ncbi:Outer membrane protein [Geosporobacter subterraneus DSM 17957]|uniref:Outer membrane protein n=1 Tax=Geosporobacter subterraneus DSM 17957 TaxID=1121919 RepID=A0A1M6NTQ8_9FIRM|nr:stalk domain-containing protein [Geosporobacter subterraneus]SHJ99045.1 Outer membrane protein [Geosporobacter subterraneus DSM 17957]
MKKGIISLVFALILLLMPAIDVFANVQSSAGDIKILVDGIEQSYNVELRLDRGNTLVPMRSIFEMLGAVVDWQETDKTVIAEKNGIRIEVKVGSYFAKVGDQIVKMPVAPVIVEDATLVPLRFISEALGAKVDWDGITRTVTITSGVDNKQEEVLTNQTMSGSTLTYEQALEKAFKSSSTLKQALIDIEKSKDNRKRAEDNLDYLPTWFGRAAVVDSTRKLFYGLIQADIAWESSKKQVALEEERIAYDVLKAYQEILKKEEELIITQLSLEQTKKEKKIVDAKAAHGLASQFDRTLIDNSLQEAQKKVEGIEKSIKDERMKLNFLMGEAKDKEYLLVDKPIYEKIDLKEEDLDFHISRTISDSTAVWLAEQNVKLAEMELDIYEYNNPNIPSYKVKEMDVDKAKTSVTDIKKQLGESMRVMYYSIKQLENQYAMLEIGLKKAEEAVKLTRTRYDAGMATDIELLQSEYTIEQIKKSMFDITVQHDQLKFMLARPWVVTR